MFKRLINKLKIKIEYKNNSTQIVGFNWVLIITLR